MSEKILKWPVTEIFGSTLQGEGVDQGLVSHFVRFGGCDYKCDWCDTPHAVLPSQVRNAPKLTAKEIIDRLEKLGGRRAAPWIILTGGNPALHDLTVLVDGLHHRGYLVAVETQGSRWRDWMGEVDRLCVSPKPPSSLQEYDFATIERFMEKAQLARSWKFRTYDWCFLKVVCFDDADLDYAEKVRARCPDFLLYLSAGNDAGVTVGNPTRVDDRSVFQVRNDLLDKTVWLTEQVFKRQEFCAPDVIVQCQFHVALWGNKLGV